MSLALAFVGLLSLRSPVVHDVAAVNLARASRIGALASKDGGQCDAAADRIRELLADDASRVPLFAELALLFAGCSRFDGKRWLWQARWVLGRAREVATETKASHRDRAVIENVAGVIALADGDAVAARERFDQAAEIDPKYAPGQLNRGILAAHVRDYDVAIEALGAGLRDRRFAHDVDAKLALAHTLAKDGDEVRALKVLRGLVHRSTDAQIDLVLAIVLMDDADFTADFERGPYDEARAALRRYLASKPKSPTLVIAAERRLGDLDDWMTDTHERPRIDPIFEAKRRADEAEEKVRLRALEAKLLGEQR
jgi:tetratricopeptide (TPR) repeat protein